MATWCGKNGHVHMDTKPHACEYTHHVYIAHGQILHMDTSHFHLGTWPCGYITTCTGYMAVCTLIHRYVCVHKYTAICAWILRQWICMVFNSFLIQIWFRAVGRSTEPESVRGLLDISTSRYFYKVPKTILHKPTANSGINIFCNKCL